jgi:hypothetical protein
MVVDGAAVQRGMEVYGQDGAKIGTVAAVHPIGQMLLGQEHIPPRGVVSDAGVVGEEVPINEPHERREVMDCTGSRGLLRVSAQTPPSDLRNYTEESVRRAAQGL